VLSQRGRRSESGERIVDARWLGVQGWCRLHHRWLRLGLRKVLRLHELLMLVEFVGRLLLLLYQVGCSLLSFELRLDF
jgi:hypothetical protein